MEHRRDMGHDDGHAPAGRVSVVIVLTLAALVAFGLTVARPRLLPPPLAERTSEFRSVSRYRALTKAQRAKPQAIAGQLEALPAKEATGTTLVLREGSVRLVTRAEMRVEIPGGLREGDTVGVRLTGERIGKALRVESVRLLERFEHAEMRDWLKTRLGYRLDGRTLGRTLGGSDGAAFVGPRPSTTPRLIASRMTPDERRSWLAGWERARRPIPGAISYMYAFDTDAYLVVYFSKEREPEATKREVRVLMREFGKPERFAWASGGWGSLFAD